MLYHSAALIHDQRGADVPGFQHIDDLRRAVAHDLLIAGKGKVNIMLRGKAFVYQRFRRL